MHSLNQLALLLVLLRAAPRFYWCSPRRPRKPSRSRLELGRAASQPAWRHRNPWRRYAGPCAQCHHRQSTRRETRWRPRLPTLPTSSADCHTARTSREAPARSPSASNTRATASRPGALAGCSPTKRRTVAASRRSCHSLASARRRNSGIARPIGIGFGGKHCSDQTRRGYRDRADMPTRRVSAPTGSLIDAASVVASLNLCCCTSWIACFTATRSGDICNTGSGVPMVSVVRIVLGPGARSTCLASVTGRCL